MDSGEKSKLQEWAKIWGPQLFLTFVGGIWGPRGCFIGALLGGAATLWGYKQYRWLRAYTILLALSALSVVGLFLMQWANQGRIQTTARMYGPYGPNAKDTEVDLSVENSRDEAIQNVDLVLTRKSTLNILGISPVFASQCVSEPLNPFSDLDATFKGADGVSHLRITTDDVAKDYIQHFGSLRWELRCTRFGAKARDKFRLLMRGNADQDVLFMEGSYELIASQGSKVVGVSIRVPIK